MSEAVDITGMRFGKLVAIEPDEEKSGHNIKWICRCDCGNIVSVRGTNLRNGSKTSCGCGRRCNPRIIDLSGNKYGKLFVISFAKVEKGDAFFNCRCDCGNEIIVRGSSLKSGKTKSCGCLKFEVDYHKYNKYEETEEYYIGYASNNDMKFIFDKDDFELIKQYTWFEDNRYIKTNVKNVDTNRYSVIKLHRLIMGVVDKNIFVDHINGDTLNNRKNNLRLVTEHQNAMNTKISKANRLGCKGVTQVKSGKYVARIRYNNQGIHIGTFDTLEEAIEARRLKENELYGDFSSFLSRGEQNR